MILALASYAFFLAFHSEFRHILSNMFAVIKPLVIALKSNQNMLRLGIFVLNIEISLNMEHFYGRVIYSTMTMHNLDVLIIIYIVDNNFAVIRFSIYTF